MPADTSVRASTARRGGSRDLIALAVAMGFALAVVAATALVCWRTTDRQIIYALDDPYIHMAVARTLAQSGVYGVNEQTPCAASSSPLWTLLLAGLFRALGVRVWLPLALNLLAVIALVLAIDAVLRHVFIVPPLARVAVVAAVVFIAPLAPVVMTGMEHVAHAAVLLLLAMWALRTRPAPALLLAVLALLATGLRYETGFIVAALAVIKAVRGEWRGVAGLVLGTVIAVVGVGLAQLSAGAGFLPSSLLVKGLGHTNLLRWFTWRLEAAAEAARLAPLAVLAVACAVVIASLLSSRRADSDRARGVDAALIQWSALFLMATLLHWSFAKTSWRVRYDAYLVVLGGTVVAGGLCRMLGEAWARLWAAGAGWRARLGAILAVGAVCAPFVLSFAMRMVRLPITPIGCRNIYQQQGQMARFVREFYNDSPIVVTDLGFVAFLSRAPILDLCGLGSPQIARAIVEDRRDAAFVERAAHEHRAVVAVIYLGEYIPKSWQHVASWRIPDNRVCGDDTVHFYAVQQSALPILERNLHAFERELPQGVEVAYGPE
jgi:hypothetical protein